MTTRLFTGELRLPAAPVGFENALPPLRGQRDLHHVENLADLPPELQQNILYGGLPSTLPCLDQDGYGRTLVETALPSLVLENDQLRATVLPGLGGRLYSLVHKPTGRELLYRNPVLQPANLALRNAWSAGGVEWNVGSTGHWTGTCSPMHAARVDGPDGSPMLRLWEWERSRGLVVQLDFWLPPDSELLYVGARIQNPADHDVPAYWWSNIAVEQSPDTRVLVPADQAWRFGYENRLDLVNVSAYQDFDPTYVLRHRRAVDFFFELLPGQRPWIAALDGEGCGLVQLSTDRLRGRKLFVWGESRGGRRWQEWLSPGQTGPGYAEIQAGLARTQLEHLRLPAATNWHWLEAYGRLAVDPALAHADDWVKARTDVASHINSLLSATELAAREASWLTVADAPPREVLAAGSGWGALELARTGWQVSTGTPFGPETMTDRERKWLPLLAGELPASDSAVPPDGTLVAWRDQLEVAEDNWLVWYHRGVARWYAGDAAGAVEAWRASVRLQDRPGHSGIWGSPQGRVRRRSRCTSGQPSWRRKCCRWWSKRSTSSSMRAGRTWLQSFSTKQAIGRRADPAGRSAGQVGDGRCRRSRDPPRPRDRASRPPGGQQPARAGLVPGAGAARHVPAGAGGLRVRHVR